MSSHIKWGSGLACAALVVATLVGCGARPVASGPQDLPPAPADQTAPTVQLYTPMPVLSQAATAASTPTPDPLAATLPFTLTGYEIIASNASPAIYSGYRCIIAVEAGGCNCENYIFETGSFRFWSDNQMTYYFSGEGYSAEWDMKRLGNNHWSYEVPFINEEGDVIGVYLSLLTFNENGFEYNLGVDFGTGDVITCETVQFRRIATALNLTATP